MVGNKSHLHFVGAAGDLIVRPHKLKVARFACEPLARRVPVSEIDPLRSPAITYDNVCAL